MNQVSLYIFDTNNYSELELLEFVKANDDDLALFKTFKNETVRKEKIISQYFKRHYIGDFYLNEHGKPLSDKVFFNISHSHGVVVLALNDKYHVGVDIELEKEVKEEIKSYISNNEEYQYIKTSEDFLSIWTSKESLVKANGTGLNGEIKNIPGLPLNGKKTYLNQAYFSHLVKKDNSFISITLMSDEDFIINIKEEWCKS